MIEERSLNSFKKGAEQLQISLTDQQYQQFIHYYEMLVEKNKVMNLTAITEWEEVIVKHFLDSLALVKACDLNQAETLLDLGTGAGFPGIPLKIAFPQLRVCLLDSLAKRIRFLDEVQEQLGLAGVETIHGRAEDLAKKEGYREGFDLCVSRAVAALPVLSEYCMPFVKKGGCFIPYKSGKLDEELRISEKAVSILGGRIERQIKFQLADTDMERAFVVIRKTAPTPKKYPRKAGTAAKEPLV